MERDTLQPLPATHTTTTSTTPPVQSTTLKKVRITTPSDEETEDDKSPTPTATPTPVATTTTTTSSFTSNNNNVTQDEYVTVMLNGKAVVAPKNACVSMPPSILLAQLEQAHRQLDRALNRIEKLESQLEDVAGAERNLAIDVAGYIATINQMQQRLNEQDNMMSILHDNNLYFQAFFYKDEEAPASQQVINQNLLDHIRALKNLKTVVQNSAPEQPPQQAAEINNQQNPVELDRIAAPVVVETAAAPVAAIEIAPVVVDIAPVVVLENPPPPPSTEVVENYFPDEEEVEETPESDRSFYL